MRIRSLIACIAVPLLIGCGGLFYTEVEEENLCVTLHDQEIPALAGAFHHHQVHFDLGSFLPKELNRKDAEIEVRLRSFSLEATSGVNDLNFLRRMGLWTVEKTTDRILLPDEYALQEELATWVAPNTPTLIADFEMGANRDISDHVRKRKLELMLQFEGDFPFREWTLETTACFHVRGRVNYLE